MIDLLTYLMQDCPAVAAIDGQAALAHMREKLTKNPPSSLVYLQAGPAVTFVDGTQAVLVTKEASTGNRAPVVSLSEPSQGRTPERSRTAAGVPIIPVIRPYGQ